MFFFGCVFFCCVFFAVFFWMCFFLDVFLFGCVFFVFSDVFFLDVHPTAIRVARQLEAGDPRLTLSHRPLAHLALCFGPGGAVSGIALYGVLAGLGNSRPQLGGGAEGSTAVKWRSG